MSTIPSTIPAQSGLRGLIQRHPVLSMYAIMFLLAWSVMVPQALHSQGILPTPVPGFLDILTGWAPGIAAAVVMGITAGRAGIRQLFGRFLIWRVNVLWYLVAFFLLAALIMGGIGLHVLFGGAVPPIPAAGTVWWQLVLIFLLYVVLGFLINTEEIAWRGFALPRLQARYGALIAALLITIPEVILHLPLFLMKDNMFFQTVGVGLFSAFSVALVFIYVFIFNRTRGSLLLVTILHASQNAWSNLLSDNSRGPFIFTVLLIWVIALAIIAATRGKLGFEHPTT